MAAEQAASGPEILIVTADYPTASPEVVFAHWTEPQLLEQWWPTHAENEPRLGGAYHLSWPQQGWHLRGRYTAFEPGKRLVFTWQWDHDAPESEAREVSIVLTPLTPSGTSLRLTHGPYRETPDDQTLRIEDHLAGWLHFLPRLQALLNTPD